ncbi:MAG: hypothetical protein Q8N59_02250, partial [bacterium]|nr:hypothetical protein [bacterium]
LLAARTAQNRGYMREATNEQAQAAMKAYETFGDSEMLRKLEELRPDAIISKKGETTEKTEERRKDAEERAFSNGTYRQWSKQVLDKNKFGPQIIQEMRKQLSTGEFASVFKTWTKDVRSAAEESMQKTFTDDFAAKADGSDNDNVANRKALYRVTNNAEKTFYSDANGTVRPEWLEEGSAADIVAGQAVATTNAETMDKITPEASLKLAARHITSKQVPTLGYGMQNAKAKEVIRAEIDDLIIRQKAQLAMLDSSRSTAADAAALAETEAKMREVQTRIDDRTKIQNLMKKSGYWGGTEITPTP